MRKMLDFGVGWFKRSGECARDRHRERENRPCLTYDLSRRLNPSAHSLSSQGRMDDGVLLLLHKMSCEYGPEKLFPVVSTPVVVL